MEYIRGVVRKEERAERWGTKGPSKGRAGEEGWGFLYLLPFMFYLNLGFLTK